MIIQMSDFIEFKNTKAAKKAIAKETSEGLSLRFAMVPSGKQKAISTIVSPDLVKCMEEHNLTRFKLLINPTTLEIIFVYDNSSKCIDLANYTTQKLGKQFMDKYITYTLLPEVIKKGGSSLKYTCEYNDSLKIILATPKK